MNSIKSIKLLFVISALTIVSTTHVLAYNATQSVNTFFKVTSGKATCKVTVIGKNPSSLTRVHGLVKIMNKNGVCVKTYDLDFKETSSVYSFNKTYSLSKKGTYYASVNVKCYKGRTLKDNITKKTVSDSFR